MVKEQSPRWQMNVVPVSGATAIVFLNSINDVSEAFASYGGGEVDHIKIVPVRPGKQASAQEARDAE